MTAPAALDRWGGVLMIGALAFSVPHEFTGAPIFSHLAAACAFGGLALFAPRVSRAARLFLVLGPLVLLAATITLPDWPDATLTALARGAFIAAFFTALTAIRSAAITDPGILDCGRFLAAQPPGRRYLALTLGGHLYGLVLMYGSIALLGALATENARQEPNPEIRGHRSRRMLVAVQRGFISTLPWSPLTFASAISLSVVPGATWAAALPLCAVSVALVSGIGWALDTLFKPRLSAPAPARGPAEGAWLSHLRPLYTLLALLGAAVATLHITTGVRVFGAVMAIVPLIALVWVTLQPGTRGARGATLARRAGAFATQEMPQLRSELSLLVMAAFIGTLGSALAEPLAARAGLDLTAVPTPLLLLAVFWLIPVTGQMGMNPILAVSLFGPLLPAPETLGISPALMVCTITSGWALSGATSPFTASVLLIANYGGVSPLRVGIGWNGTYALICGAALSLWILALAALA
ncbi:hypothetical protein [Roseivivax sediminis]|uniref:H+/citrate symporter n=1 Tax=Roseivivax sediminis TaxID=936889 RepID=A0A1I1T3A1_9RHOB|nr:hypothetical protein [Roseivivax sediminis]SFD53124.1 hypothetical protein SAMN04515678_101461 [Roseivivax sediminis]